MTKTKDKEPSSDGQKTSDSARFDLLPPDALWLLAEHYGKAGGPPEGPPKYEERNWEKGYAWSLSFAALMRHAWAWWYGEDVDPETKSRHMVAAAWHCLNLTAMQYRNIGTDDRSKGTRP